MDYLNYEPYTLHTDDDFERLKKWEKRSRYELMLDAYAEAESAVNMKKKNYSYEDIKTQFESLSKICAIIYASRDSEGFKKELQQEEAFLYDFLLGDDLSRFDCDSIMIWWNEWTNMNWEVCI